MLKIENIDKRWRKITNIDDEQIFINKDKMVFDILQCHVDKLINPKIHPSFYPVELVISYKGFAGMPHPKNLDQKSDTSKSHNNKFGNALDKIGKGGFGVHTAENLFTFGLKTVKSDKQDKDRDAKVAQMCDLQNDPADGEGATSDYCHIHLFAEEWWLENKDE